MVRGHAFLVFVAPAIPPVVLAFVFSSFVARTGTDVQWRRGRQDGAADGGRAAHELFCMTLWKSGEGGNGFARGWWEFLRVALALAL